MKYILYARKSTEDREDRQVLSIESQIEEVKRKYPGIEIAEVIREAKSAYKPNARPGFQRMMRLFETGKAEGLLAWHPDRLSREPISGGMVIHLLDRKLIRDLRFASYNFDNSPEGKWMLSLVLSQSKYFSEKLGVDVKRGMTKKCEMGCMPTRSPVGYMSDATAEKGRKRHIEDPVRFALVRKLWDMMLTGQYSAQEVARRAAESGLTTRPTKAYPARALFKNTLYKIFRNPFYAGKFNWDGELYDGSHPAMVTWAEFEKVQRILSSTGRPRPKYLELPYRGLIKCECGAIMYCDSALKRNPATGEKRRYLYLRCAAQKKKGRGSASGCQAPSLSFEEAERQIAEYLGTIRISDAFHGWATKNLKHVKTDEDECRRAELAVRRKAYDDCQKKIDNLVDLKISPENRDGSLLDNEDFLRRKNGLLVERQRLAEMVEQSAHRADKFGDIAVDVFDTARRAQEAFENGDVEEKKLILSKIAVNFVQTGGKLHIEAKKPYIVFEKRLPEVRAAEQKCELEKNGDAEPRSGVLEGLISAWSSLLHDVQTVLCEATTSP
jgi:DNA invertase Pin-like site-specific DNA recombinase